MSTLENYMKQQAVFCEQNDSISKNLYSEYGVKRGLRDEKGQGVLTGLTNISDIKAFEYRDDYFNLHAYLHTSVSMPMSDDTNRLPPLHL